MKWVVEVLNGLNCGYFFNVMGRRIVEIFYGNVLNFKFRSILKD